MAIYILLGLVVFSIIYTTTSQSSSRTFELPVYQSGGGDGSSQQNTEQSEPLMSIAVTVGKMEKKQAIVQGTYLPLAGAHFVIQLQNTKNIPINDVKYISKSDNKDNVTSFEDANWVTPFNTQTILPSSSSPEAQTEQFSLEGYALTAPVLTNFTFNFAYDYTRGDGTLVDDIPLSGTVELEILTDQCLGGVGYNTCTGDGRVCTYLGGSEPQLVPDATCCVNIGWDWGTDHCVPPGTCVSGQCKYTDESQCIGSLDANTYCGVDESWVEDCACPACDAQGHFSVGCSGNVHLYDDYSSGNVLVNIGPVVVSVG